MPIFMRTRQLFNRRHPTNRAACKRVLRASEKDESMLRGIVRIRRLPLGLYMTTGYSEAGVTPREPPMAPVPPCRHAQARLVM